MRTLLVVPAFLAAAAAAHAQDVAAGRRLFAGCATCHAVPDLSIRSDRLWLDSINTSA